MGALRCVDGSVLSVAAVACRDRTGQPYEITLELARDSTPFAAVGERCGYQLSQLADRVRAALHDPEVAALWPDPADRFPGPARLHDYRPGESEYFTLRSRDRSDLAGSGELRCTLRSSADWIGECGGVGGRRAAHQRAWPGVRAVLGQHHLRDQRLRLGDQLRRRVHRIQFGHGHRQERRPRVELLHGRLGPLRALIIAAHPGPFHLVPQQRYHGAHQMMVDA